MVANMQNLLNVLDNLAEYRHFIRHIHTTLSPVMLTGLAGSLRAHFIAKTAMDTGKVCAVVVASQNDARQLQEDLAFFLGEESVALYPSREYVFYNVDASDNKIVHRRLGALQKLRQAQGPFAMVTTVDAALQCTIPMEAFDEYAIALAIGKPLDTDALVQQLVLMGYSRCDVVEGCGQFAVRGGIVDIFSPSGPLPVRIEFFGDEPDTIRTFDPATQLTVENLSQVQIICCRETVYTKERAYEIAHRLRKQVGSIEALGFGPDIALFEEQHYFHSADKYLPLIYPEGGTLLSFLPEGSILFADTPDALEYKMKTMEEELGNILTNLLEKGLLHKITGSYFAGIKSLSHAPAHFAGMGALSASASFYRPGAQFNISARNMQSFLGKFQLICEDLRYRISKNHTIIVLAGTIEKATAFHKALCDSDIQSHLSLDGASKMGELTVTPGQLESGFEYPMLGTAVFTPRELFGKVRKKRFSRGDRQGTKIRNYNDLSIGDHVVHVVHGIGRYLGICRLEIDGVKKDYLKIQYHGTDVLYVPVTQLESVNKYIGSENMKLNKMGGADFDKVKSRVKKSVEDLADQLIQLYAQREHTPGFAFSKDNDWQKKFEDDFPYEETEDQTQCIEEMKSDMEAPHPMERLLCGDVGFGKTEVALRGAFKAVMDNKQVAYLVPTTILAQQHYHTFMQRMKDFPITVEMLSRFRTSAQQKAIIKKLKSGEVDVVIGTHRLLQKDIAFSDLGFLIIDEEQRFGVTHKEKIKELKKDVDVLTLTATPIPRTLHMAMVGIRDMSVISQPPEDRYPVQTFILEHNRDIVYEAVRKELDRGGQVYYVHNRVEGIHKTAADLQKAFPDANVAVGHGQMHESELEDIMEGVIENEIDILVCTTIIETGLDIPNINTIVIENADTFGLAQLYQLRGRVGRSNRIAYAYLTYRRDKMLNENAVKRLQAIREYTEFGSGFKIAMRDLEIRGAGNILGPQQHGAMDAVGYDMYCKLLDEAITLAKGEMVQEAISCTVDIKMDAYIPEEYIENHNVRIDMYKRIAVIENSEDLQEAIDEFIDRFGAPPACILNLMQASLIRSIAISSGVSDIVQKGTKIFIYPSAHGFEKEQAYKVIKLWGGKVLYVAGERAGLTYSPGDERICDTLSNIKIILQQIFQLHNV